MAKSVLISGASSGIGKALSLELDRQRYRVFATVRNAEDADAIRTTASENLVPVMLDITDQALISAACQQVGDQTGGALDCLVNNAGINISAPMEFLPTAEFRRQMEVNLFGQLALTQACLPLLRKSTGRILFISSIAGRFVTAFNGPYAASKAALIAMADALRLELAPWNIPVSVMIVGSVQTPIWEKASVAAGKLLRQLPRESWALYGNSQKQAGRFYHHAGETGMPVEKVVQVIQRSIESSRPKPYVLVGKDAFVLELGAKLLPVRLRDRWISKQMGLLKD